MKLTHKVGVTRISSVLGEDNRTSGSLDHSHSIFSTTSGFATLVTELASTRDASPTASKDGAERSVTVTDSQELQSPQSTSFWARTRTSYSPSGTLLNV